MSKISELIRDCRNSDVKISVSGRNLQIDAPKGLPDSMKEALRKHKADIIRRLTQRKDTETSIQKTELDKPAPTLTARLNKMIAAGVSFEVGPDSFQFVGASERENVFLRDNQAAILCTLHQSLLVKCLPPGYIVRFTDEINERTATISNGACGEPPFEMVAEVSRDWFIDMSEELLKR